jgi:hypothetical protein
LHFGDLFVVGGQFGRWQLVIFSAQDIVFPPAYNAFVTSKLRRPALLAAG